MFDIKASRHLECDVEVHDVPDDPLDSVYLGRKAPS
jgi:hypothetical protein